MKIDPPRHVLFLFIYLQLVDIIVEIYINIHVTLSPLENIMVHSENK